MQYFDLLKFLKICTCFKFLKLTKSEFSNYTLDPSNMTSQTSNGSLTYGHKIWTKTSIHVLQHKHQVPLYSVCRWYVHLCM